MSGGTTFANHREVVPMLWIFFGIACTELVVVHFLLAKLWPRLAWPLSIVTLLSILWLVGWIRSWPRLPHRLADDRLILHFGSLRSLVIALGDIDQVRAIQPGELNQPRLLKFVPVAYPNRVIALKRPPDGRHACDKIAIRLDDPAAFDAALREAGVVILD